MTKKKYKYNCIVCGKAGESVDNKRLHCNKCRKWSSSGLGQLNIYGEKYTGKI